MDKGEDPAGKEIRAMVPVNLRPLEDAWKLGNRFGLCRWCCPSASPTRWSGFCSACAHERTQGSFQPVMAFGLLSVAGL